MESAARAIVDRYVDPYRGPALQILGEVPPRHGVLAAAYDATIIRRGEVVVYDEMAIDSEGLVEGQIYIVEHQSPAHGLPLSMFADTPGARMRVSRSIVVLRKHASTGDSWWLDPLRAAQPGFFVMSDGPICSSYLVPKLIGKVVGIFNPAAFATVAS